MLGYVASVLFACARRLCFQQSLQYMLRGEVSQSQRLTSSSPIAPLALLAPPNCSFPLLLLRRTCPPRLTAVQPPPFYQPYVHMIRPYVDMVCSNGTVDCSVGWGLLQIFARHASLLLLLYDTPPEYMSTECWYYFVMKIFHALVMLHDTSAQACMLFCIIRSS